MDFGIFNTIAFQKLELTCTTLYKISFYGLKGEYIAHVRNENRPTQNLLPK